MIDGLLDLNPWQLVLVALALTHVTIVSVTVYLHRCQAHRALDLHPVLAHFFRFWLWLTTGMVTSEWVGIHRRHHARCETPDDPHSPQVLGLSKVLWEGAELYRAASVQPDLVERYAHGTPDDWIERRLYKPFNFVGVGVMLVVDVALFGVLGVALWAVQMIWIPFFAAGVINGVGHYWGYRNYESPDAATNIVPWGILIGGEELHNNHHAFPSSAKLSSRWWEFDVGWLYIRLFELLRLARVRRIARAPELDAAKAVIDMDTVKAVVVHRMHVLANYARDVIKPVADAELCHSEVACRRMARQARRLLVREVESLDAGSRQRLQSILERSQVLAKVHRSRQQLKQVWERTASSQEALLAALQQWCREAEGSGIKALEDFARSLRSYRPAIAVG
ncbi:MAG: fatty acid desaturase [Chromatiaceae bacterium]|nr:fatty acid desaturase [Gammaproteobacteria bacterium]MCP5300096.1 fatty acid desaturase [Chromatiaceae bacterium]MCP5422168.1 fatty acid desaturase [Chromatiaceae bacterium]